MQNNWQKANKILEKDGVVVLPTDTLYGIIGSAMSKKAVEKIYNIKGRDENKPFIVLINSFEQLKIFGIKITKEQTEIFEKFWPGKVSVVLSCPFKKWGYIHRGEHSIAFRMVGQKNKNLFDLIDKIGPVVAPSVNKQGEKPAETIKEAKNYFGNNVDLYINTGVRKSLPSTIVKFENDKIIILRQGQTKIKI